MLFKVQETASWLSLQGADAKEFSSSNLWRMKHDPPRFCVDSVKSYCYTNRKEFQMGEQKHRKYDADFKRNTVNLTNDPTRSESVVAVNLGISTLFVITFLPIYSIGDIAVILNNIIVIVYSAGVFSNTPTNGLDRIS